MIFWILVFSLALLVSVLILLPLRQSGGSDADQLTDGAADGSAESGEDLSPNRSAYDREVYKDQLSEIERDEAVGLLSPDEAELARIEISRRLLSASENSERAKTSKPYSWSALTPLILLAPIFSIAVYIFVGAPQVPDQPLALRDVGAESQLATQSGESSVPDDIKDMIERAEAHLAQNPEDGRGWDVLAPIYFRMGNYLKAQEAFAKAIKYEGSTPNRHNGLGEAIVSAQEGLVTREAELNFKRALELNPNDPRAAFFLALGLAQDGKRQEAISAFEVLAKKSPADAPWIAAIRNQIAQLKDIELSAVQLETAPATNAAPTLGNPDQEDIEAASEMNAEDRLEMIKGMVASLDAKLKDEPNNLEGWQRLLQSYMVLNQPEDAAKALTNALLAFPPESDEGKLLLIQSKELGIELP